MCDRINKSIVGDDTIKIIERRYRVEHECAVCGTRHGENYSRSTPVFLFEECVMRDAWMGGRARTSCFVVAKPSSEVKGRTRPG